MNRAEKRIARERKTISIMIRMYCREHHNPAGGLCPDCAELKAYALSRIDSCPFGWSKPTCANCPIHCYKPRMRERIRAVMLRHPLLSVLHLVDGWRKPSPLK